LTDLRVHTSQEFEAELGAVRAKLVAMGRRVDEVLDAAGRALVGRDLVLGNAIILGDRDTDSMELELDHLCLEILARRQPVAGDLRLLTSALKIVVDLERIGDLGANIATRVVELGREPPLVPYEDLLETLTIAREMVSGALDALIAEDSPRAQRIIERDSVVDALSIRIFDELVSGMRADPTSITRATRIQSISRYIERIADHGANIAERVIFILTGEDVRHQPRARRADLC
jgi:phosphate transport system protein